MVEPVRALPERLPTEVTVSQKPDVRFSPNQMRQLKAETGQTMNDLMGEGATEENRMQGLVWLELKRLGYDPSWDEAGDVVVKFEADEPDPTSAAPLTTSPDSAGFGG